MKENIYQRKDGRFEGRYPIEVDSTGKKKYKSVYGKTKKEIRQKLTEVKSKFVEADSDMTFEEAARRWLESMSNSRATTLSTYISMVEGYIIPILNDYTLAEVNINVKQEFIKRLQKENLSETSVRSYMQLVERIISFNINKKELKYDSNDNFKERPDILSNDDWKKLKTSICTDINPLKLGVACICFLGLRIGELCALKWENINFDEKTVTIEKIVERVKSQQGEKSSTRLAIMNIEPRTIPIPEPLFKELLKNREKKANYFVTTASTKLKESRTFQYSLEALLDEIGISKCTAKTIRNTFAIEALKAGVSIKTLAYVMGVKINMLTKYFEFIEVDNEKEMQKIK